MICEKNSSYLHQRRISNFCKSEAKLPLRRFVTLLFEIRAKVLMNVRYSTSAPIPLGYVRAIYSRIIVNVKTSTVNNTQWERIMASK